MHGSPQKACITSQHTAVLADIAGSPGIPIQSRLLGLQWLAELADPQPPEPTAVLPRTTVEGSKGEAGDGSGPAGKSMPGTIGLQDVRLQALLRGSHDIER